MATSSKVVVPLPVKRCPKWRVRSPRQSLRSQWSPTRARSLRVKTVSDVRVLAVGSEEFFAALEHDKGMRRTTVVAKDGETLATIGRRYDVSPTTMERVNRKSRKAALKAGETVVLYVPNAAGPGGAIASAGAGVAANVGSSSMTSAAGEPVPNGPLHLPPVPDLLP